MSDYIRRDKALAELHLDHKDVIYIDKQAAAERIRKIPYLDIVRCKECKHQWREHKVCAHEANVVDGVCGKRAEDDDFCSYGERSGP